MFEGSEVKTEKPEEKLQPPQETAILKPKKPKIKFEDLHIRKTMWVKKDLWEKIEKLSAESGWTKTEIVEEALSQLFEKGNENS